MLFNQSGYKVRALKQKQEILTESISWAAEKFRPEKYLR